MYKHKHTDTIHLSMHLYVDQVKKKNIVIYKDKENECCKSSCITKAEIE